MSGEAALIQMSHISKTFPGVVALDDVQFIAKGEIHALLGENGAGKSTLIKGLRASKSATEDNCCWMEGSFPKTPQEAQDAGISTGVPEGSTCPNTLGGGKCLYWTRTKKGGRIDWKTINTRSKGFSGAV